MTIDTVLGNSSKPTAMQLKAALAATIAVAEAIRELGSVPSGTLYANIMDKVDLAGYEGILRNLKGAGLFKDDSHLLVWIGPNLR